VQKNKAIKTVVNKLDSIDTRFRFFKMELLAGEPDYVVEHVGPMSAFRVIADERQ
jgi:tRNA (guanine37-N1)-methyltransferase